MDRDLYERIIAAYRETGSVDRTAEICGTYAIKVRKVLITEGLWHSKKSDAVNALRNRGYSASEIAVTLGMEEKNVQFYLPYSDPAFLSERNSSQARVSEFRGRGRKAEKGILFREGIKASEEKRTGENRATAPVEYRGNTLKESGGRKKGITVDGWSGYQLHIELVANNYLSEETDDLDPFRDEPDAVSLRKLLKTKGGICRDVIVPGCMSLHQLSYVIQQLFGFMNSHLHHFSLPKELLQQLTEGEVRKWAEMCGTYLRAPVVEDFSDLYWDDDYKQGKSIKNWNRSKYTGRQENYAVGETYIDGMRLLKRAMDRAEKGMQEREDTRRFQDLSMEEYHHKYAAEAELNAVLERLTVEDLFLEEGESLPDPDAWREDLHLAVNTALSYLEAFRGTESFRSLEEAMGLLRQMREDRDALAKAIWLRKEEVRAALGRNPEDVLEEMEGEIYRLQRQIGEAMHAFDPSVQPVTDKLYYHYDYGDDWLLRIVCNEIYFRVEEETDEKETKAALRKVGKTLGFRYPEIDRKLEACGWGRNYMEEYLFEDSRGREVHNMLYVPLCNCFLETKPVCVRADGVPLVEDVGGVGGFFDFIRNIHGKDAEKAASLRTWARGLGWKEIVPRPGSLL